MNGEEQSPDAYAAALDRLLDGLEPEAGAAGAEASADIDAITRALGLIGNTLAAEGAPPAAVPVGESAGVVVAMSSWRRRLSPRVLAAAAAGLLVLGLGVPIALSAGGGSSDDSATAMDAPNPQTESAAGTAAAAPVAPQTFGTGTSADSTAGTDTTVVGNGALAGAGTSQADAAVPGAAATAPLPSEAKAAGPASDAAASTMAGKSASKRSKSADAFGDAVACARAILVGQITAVQPGSAAGRVKVTLLVTDWIEPSTGPALITYEVGQSDALTPDGSEKLTAGQRRLFVIPAKPSAQAYAYPDSAASRQEITAVRTERSGEGCQ